MAADPLFEQVEFTQNPRARRVRLRVDHHRRRVVVVVPSKAQRARAEAFVTAERGWIEDALAKLPPARPFAEGVAIPIGGVDHLLKRLSVRGRPELVSTPEPAFHVPSPPDMFASRVERALRALAKTKLQTRVAVHTAALGEPAGRISVKDTKSRWGSCAAGGSMSFSWRLICAPPEVLDYVAAHEAAHLRHRHHGPAFWAEVDRLYGDPSDAMAWLKTNGASLFAVGAQA